MMGTNIQKGYRKPLRLYKRLNCTIIVRWRALQLSEWQKHQHLKSQLHVVYLALRLGIKKQNTG